MHASSARAYVTTFCAASLLIVGAVCALNYYIDPYLTHQWDTPAVQRLRPTREKLSAWSKTYAVARFQPQVVFLGNSRTELGLPTSLPLFAGKTVFNSALSGASIGDAIALAEHARHVSRLELVVWGIDAPSFSMEYGNTDLDRELIGGGPHYLLRRGLLNLKRAVTVDMTRDSINVLRGRFEAVCHSSLVFNGQRDDACIELRIGGWGGTRNAVLPRTREYIRGAGPTAEAYAEFQRSVDALCAGATRVRLYINPTHAMMLDALYWSGKWEPVEAWQTWLARLAATRRAGGCDVRVYDFSGYNSITTETIPQVSQRNVMQHYWETSHYRSNVGRMILGRLFGAAGSEAPPDDFGVELEPAMMVAHLARLRYSRDRYHQLHPQETALARQIAAERR